MNISHMNRLDTSSAKRSFNLRTGVVSANEKRKKIKNEDSTVVSHTLETLYFFVFQCIWDTN